MISILMIKMKHKIRINKVRKIKNDQNFDQEITIYLSERVYARRKDIVNYFLKKKKNVIGYSWATINRNLDKMVEEKKILCLRADLQAKYGIVEKDKRAVYFVLVKTGEIRKFLEDIFPSIFSKDVVDQKQVLNELEFYKNRYVPDREQLDSIVELLNSPDEELVNQAVRVLYENILEKNNRPNKEDLLVSNLKNILVRFSSSTKPSTTSAPNLRTSAIHLLGFYNDEEVINQLKNYIKSAKITDPLESAFWSKFTADAIETHRKELSDLERELRKAGEHQNAQILGSIRYRAFALLEPKKEIKENKIPEQNQPFQRFFL